MKLTVGRLELRTVIERAGPTRPTWLLPEATPEAVERHRAWLAPHFLDDKGRLLQSIHSFVVRAPGFTAEPHWCSNFDSDAEAARKTRRAFCERYADRAVTVLGTHFHAPTAGRIVRHGDAWRFEVS